MGFTQLTDDGKPKQGPLATDGTRIYFSEGATGSLTIAQVSVMGGQTAPISTGLPNALMVPESAGKIGPFWVDQNTLIAATMDASRFLTFDFTAQKWSQLASGTFVNWFISPDGKYLNCTTGGGDPTALRIRIADGKTETVTSLKGLRRVMDPRYGTQVNVAPDGSLLFTRDIGTQEIYALDVKWP